MAKYDYNLIVIGGGAAGLVASYIAAAAKAKVALIEQHKMGGDCLYTGCVPSKALISTAKLVHDMKRADEFGLKPVKASFDFQDIMKRVGRIIKVIEPHDSPARYESLGVTCLKGHATIIVPHKVQLKGKILTARAIIIATGASPLVPNLPGLKGLDYLTSDNIWQLDSLPKRLLVLGGGPIGIEMAQSFARLGSKVSVVEMANHILTREDDDVIDLLSHKLTGEGIKLLTAHKAVQFGDNHLIAEHKGKKVKIEFDKLLIALGRKANIKGFGLEALGVAMRANQTIDANGFMQTNIKGLYVCGDVTGPYQFTHMAAHQAWYAAVNGLLAPFKQFKIDYGTVPWATYCEPEIARVGLNEKQALADNIPHETTLYSLAGLDRAVTDSANEGFVKVLTKPSKGLWGKDKIIGATIVGPHASDMMGEFVLAMKQGIGLNKILGTIHIYPTYSEAVKNTAGKWRAAHAPQFALKLLQKYHSWRR